MKRSYRIVYTADWKWWEIVSREGGILTEEGENWPTDNAEELARLAGLNDDEADFEQWIAPVTFVHEDYNIIEPGDYACCDGYGCDVVFIREDKK